MKGLGGFAAGLASGMQLGKMYRDYKDDRELKDELKSAGNAQPTQEFSPEQSQQLEAAANARDANGNPLYDVKANEGGTYSVTGTAGGETGTMTPGLNRLGGRTQAEAFSPQQIQAERSRRVGDAYSSRGMLDKANSAYSLAKANDEEGVTAQIRSGATTGLKKDMTDDEKMFAMSKGMYEAAMRVNRPDLASGYYNQMNQTRDALVNRNNDRAERIYRSTGNISGYVDTYNKYVADGRTIDDFKKNEDGSHVFTLNDGQGRSQQVAVPKDKLGEYLLALRDPKRISELEQQRASTLFKAQADKEEFLYKEQNKGHVLKDENGNERVVTMAGGGQLSSGAQSFPKSLQPRLAEINKGIVAQAGTEKNMGLAGNHRMPDENTMQLSTKAAALLEANPHLSDEAITEIIVKGKASAEPVEITHPVTGEKRRVPAYVLGDKIYPMIERDGIKPNNPVPDSVNKRFDDLRSPNAQIFRQGAKPGLNRAPTPTDFPRVTPGQQSARDVEAGKLLVSEAGGVDRARNDLAELDRALSSKRLDGTQRGILQSQRDRLAAGISALL